MIELGFIALLAVAALLIAWIGNSSFNSINERAQLHRIQIAV